MPLLAGEALLARSLFQFASTDPPRTRCKPCSPNIDLSSLLPLVDVCLTARFIDGYLLVIEWERTPSDVVTHALETASGIGDKLVGAVLNKTKTGQLQRFQVGRDDRPVATIRSIRICGLTRYPGATADGAN